MQARFINDEMSKVVRRLGGEEQIPRFFVNTQAIKKLTDAQRAVVIAATKQRLKEIQRAPQAKSDLGQRIRQVRYVEPPVDPWTFLTDMQYAGALGRSMFPLLQIRFCQIFTNPMIREVILAGSIGWGKSYFGRIAVCYMLYRLLCIREPMVMFGNDPTTPIKFVSMSVTAKAADKVMWAQVVEAMAHIPWFEKQNYVIQKTDKTVWFPKQNLHYVSGSSSNTSIIGENVIGGTLDEANFMHSAPKSQTQKIAGETDHARYIYNNMARRQKSRFLLPDQSVIAKLLLISSKQFPNDFLSQKMKEHNLDPTVAILDYPQWLPRMTGKEHAYGKGRFYVFLGNSQYPSRMLGTVGTDITRQALRAIEVPPGTKIQAVPDHYRKDYETGLYGAIRDISGWSILAKTPYFDRPELYRKCICVEAIGDLPRVHPFYEDEPKGASLSYIDRESFLTMRVNEKGEEYNSAHYDHVKNIHKFTTVPRINPERSRYIHVDLGLGQNDGAAIAIGHFAGYKSVRIEEIVNGKAFVYIEERPTMITDIMVRFYAPPGNHRLEPQQIRKIVWALIEFGCFKVKRVTYDQYQSVESIDAFRSAGFDAQLFSVDRDDTPYQLLRRAMYDQRVSVYQYEPLFQDLSSLEYDAQRGKVDHTGSRDDGTEGTKDVSDCLASIFAQISDDYASHRKPMPMMLGEFEEGEHSVAQAKKDFIDELRASDDPDLDEPNPEDDLLEWLRSD